MAAGAPRRLLLHGFTGSAEDWAAVELPGLNLALDLPGHRAAPDPQGGFDASVAALLAALPESIDEVVGYSFGGRLALGLLRIAPRRFARATVIAAHPGLTSATERAARREADARWIRLLREQGTHAFVRAWEEQPLFASQRQLPAAVLDRQRECRRSHRPEGLAACLERLGLGQMPNAWPDLAAYAGELRWIVGGRDPRFLAIARQVAARRPATLVRVIEGVGHNPLLEAPARLAAALRA